MKRPLVAGIAKKSRVTLVIAALIVVLAALIVLTLLRGNESVSAAAGAASKGGGGQGTVVRVREVVSGTIENQVVLSGDVIAASQVSLYPTVAGTLIDLRVRTGDTVRAGQTVAMVDPSRPGDSFRASPVISTVSGAVVQAPVAVGDSLETRSAVCVIGDLSELRVETHVPERYSVNMRKSLPAQVRFEAMGDEVFAAEVDELSPVLDPASRTRRIRLRFVPGPSGKTDSRILAGMFATVSLVTNSRSGVALVPRAALINTYGSWIVFVSDNGVARRREVKIGLENEDSVEIISGVSVGESVVTAGQNFLSEGDSLKITE